jgi:hypothetical protein
MMYQPIKNWFRKPESTASTPGPPVDSSVTAPPRTWSGPTIPISFVKELLNSYRASIERNIKDGEEAKLGSHAINRVDEMMKTVCEDIPSVRPVFEYFIDGYKHMLDDIERSVDAQSVVQSQHHTGGNTIRRRRLSKKKRTKSNTRKSRARKQ